MEHEPTFNTLSNKLRYTVPKNERQLLARFNWRSKNSSRRQLLPCLSIDLGPSSLSFPHDLQEAKLGRLLLLLLMMLMLQSGCVCPSALALNPLRTELSSSPSHDDDDDDDAA
jgi:hypothetical protein